MRQLPGCVCWKGQIPKLKDPPIYPSRVGAAPEVDTSRYDQPNTYLRLARKYFFLILKYGSFQNPISILIN